MNIIVHFPERIDPKLVNKPSHPNIFTEPFESASHEGDKYYINGRFVDKVVYENLIPALAVFSSTDTFKFIDLT